MKTVLKLLVWIVGILAAVAGLAYFKKENTPEYIEIYSDNDDGLF
ncbi:MAG: hypothetical protein RR709_03130 [Ruthenibacterium sp.]